MSGTEHTQPGAWARRRAAVRAEAEMLERQKQESVIARHHEELAKKPEAEVLAELDLPEPEDLEAGDDFSAFMKSTVPAAIRNRALRKLWLTDPVLANVDNLVEYGEDFTAQGKLGVAIKTAYRVGKGILSDEQEEDKREEVPGEIADVAAEGTPSLPEPETEVELEATQPEIAQIADVAEPIRPAVRPRMKFEFTTTKQGRE